MREMNKMMNKMMCKMMNKTVYKMMILHQRYGSTTDNSGSTGSEQNEFLIRWIFEINRVHHFLSVENDSYRLTPGEIYEIQDVLYNRNYTIEPLSPEDVFIKSSPADDVVITAFLFVLKRELAQSFYFRDSCYSNYRKTKNDFLDTIQWFREIETLICINCSNSKYMFSRSRLIEKIAPIVHNDDYVVKLISSICNLPVVIDDTAKDISKNPLISFLASIIFNIICDDIDHQIEERLPELQYVRFEHEIFIPIYQKDKEKEISIISTLIEIFNQCNFSLPVLECAYRGGPPIPFSDDFIFINNKGMIKKCL